MQLGEDKQDSLSVVDGEKSSIYGQTGLSGVVSEQNY
jgi:hypothetical protein